MTYRRRLILSIFWILLGASLLGSAMAGLIDEFWSGMGGGLIAVGVLQMIRLIRYKTNEEYREQVDVNNSDERNKYIASKAWAWAGYLFVMIGAVATIVLRILGQSTLSTWTAGSICLIMVLYWLCYLVLSKKY